MWPKWTITSFRPGFKTFLFTSMFLLHKSPCYWTGLVVPMYIDRRNRTQQAHKTCQRILNLRTVELWRNVPASKGRKDPWSFDHTLKGQLTPQCHFAFTSPTLKAVIKWQPGKLLRKAACRGGVLPLSSPDSPVNLVSVASPFLGSSWSWVQSTKQSRGSLALQHSFQLLTQNAQFTRKFCP